jgi:hypothetical protein
VWGRAVHESTFQEARLNLRRRTAHLVAFSEARVAGTRAFVIEVGDADEDARRCCAFR